ncbi:MAG: hypothetical protein HY819_03160 [Acidobacteria bacterium]|nr:hypothetical protein [Acidobacteriota bacterium]
MAVALRIYQVDFDSPRTLSSTSIQANLQIVTPPITLGNNKFIIAIRLKEPDFDQYLSRFYQNYAIMQITQEDKSDYKPTIWTQIIGIVDQAQQSNIEVDF